MQVAFKVYIKVIMAKSNTKGNFKIEPFYFFFVQEQIQDFLERGQDWKSLNKCCELFMLSQSTIESQQEPTFSDFSIPQAKI